MKTVHYLSTIVNKTNYSLIRLIRHVVYVGEREITTPYSLSKYGSLMMIRVTLKYSTMVITLVKQESRSSTQRK